MRERESDVPWDPLAIEIEKLTSEPSRRRTKPSTRPAAMFHSWHRQRVGAIRSSTWRAPHTHTRLPLTHGPSTRMHIPMPRPIETQAQWITLRLTRRPRLSVRGAGTWASFSRENGRKGADPWDPLARDSRSANALEPVCGERKRKSNTGKEKKEREKKRERRRRDG